ncbi:hypothetical protein ZWY2020_040571 [Hordeum vulgare]|nr:hypothetical protein ZWY2020_040571 [Hordeum vulgare]
MTYHEVDPPIGAAAPPYPLPQDGVRGSPPPQHQQRRRAETAKLASHCWTAGLDGFLIYWDFATAELVRKTFTELKTATRNFRPDNELGEGGFGSVFKG